MSDGTDMPGAGLPTSGTASTATDATRPSGRDMYLGFGRLATAMVTPFTDDGTAIDHEAAAALARHLVDDQRNDALVVNGTTGESPTTTESEKFALLDTVLEAVGDRARVIAGVGSYDTAHSVRMATQAAAQGAHGLLVVTPYYNRPTQRGIIGHFTAVAGATDVPIMVYDVPHRTSMAISTETMIALAELPTVVAVKDAKGDLAESSQVIAATSLAYYSGDDPLTLPLLSVGGHGLVGTSTHVTGALTAELFEAWDAHDTDRCLRLHQQLLPLWTGIFTEPGCAMVKAVLAARGHRVGPLRLPMVAPEPAAVERYLALLG